MGAAWLDYDRDGDLDLFVVNYLDWSPRNNKLCRMDGRRLTCSPTDYAGVPNLLYRNDGAGRFTDVSAETGVAAHVGKGMSAAVADADGDGYPDIFVANDEMRHFLFRNGVGRRFVEAAVEAGVAFTEDGVPVSGMGSDFRDIDDYGHPDILVTTLSGDPFALYLGTERGFFVPSNYALGLGFATVPMGGWGTGAYDLDDDGRVDVVVSAIGEPPAVLFNTSDAGHWIALRLKGTKSNRDGIGATVTLTDGSGRVQHNHATTAVGYASSSDRRVHFGLGAARSAREIDIRWPSGTRQVLSKVAADRVVDVEEP